MERIVGSQAHLSDLINGAIEALVAAQYELPALSTLRRLAGGVHAQATHVWFMAVSARLDEAIRKRLDDLLTVPEDAQESSFATLRKPTKRISRDHLDALLQQLKSLTRLSLPQDLLADVPPARINTWAEEARRGPTVRSIRKRMPSPISYSRTPSSHKRSSTRLGSFSSSSERAIHSHSAMPNI